MASLDPDSYLKQRVDEQLQWLSRASRTSKRQFMAWRILEILLGTSITILSPLSGSLPWAPLTIAVAGGGIAVSGALLALNRSQENWVRYRSLAEGLKREKYLFLTASPPYDQGVAAFPRFVQAAEDLMGEERGGWARLQVQATEGAPAPVQATEAASPPGQATEASPVPAPPEST